MNYMSIGQQRVHTADRYYWIWADRNCLVTYANYSALFWQHDRTLLTSQNSCQLRAM